MAGSEKNTFVSNEKEIVMGATGAGGHVGQGALAPLAAGAWFKDQEEGGQGHVLWSQYCTLDSPNLGQVRVTLNQPCSQQNFAVGFCFIGPFVQNVRWTLEEVSDTVKLFKFVTPDGEDPAAPSFSFIMMKGAR